MAEAEDLKSSQCGFDPHSGHHFVRKSSGTLGSYILVPGYQFTRNDINLHNLLSL